MLEKKNPEREDFASSEKGAKLVLGRRLTAERYRALKMS